MLILTVPIPNQGERLLLGLRIVQQKFTPMSIEQLTTWEKRLPQLDLAQTRRLLHDLVTKHPELVKEIDSLLRQSSYSPIRKSTLTVDRTIDITPFQRQVRVILLNAVRALESGDEEDPISEELLSIVQTAVDFSERGDGKGAIAILDAITSTCVENWDDVADYGAENEEIVQELNEAWCESILTTELIPEEKEDIQVNLETWQDEWDADFGLALEALHQGWDYPPLVQVLQGNKTEIEAAVDAPDYAEDLALIRLKILEREERYQEYLYLAKAEGKTQQYLTMLGRLGHIEEAISLAQTQMTSMNEAFALAKTLRDQDALQHALHIAQTGLTLPGDCQYDLATWTSDLAESLGDNQAALKARKVAFSTIPSFTQYQKIENLAVENWASLKTDLLNVLRAYKGWGTEDARVDIFLHEGLIDEAIATVTELSSYYSTIIYKVMDAAVFHNPNWVIKNACSRAEFIMDAGKAEYYLHAIDWLKKVRSAYLASGRIADWSTYKASLIQAHSRKHKLMGLFKQPGME